MFVLVHQCQSCQLLCIKQDEKECSYYLKTGQCKFGITCKFHHPPPTGETVPASARPFYSTVQSPSAPSPEQYAGPSAGYRVARPPLVPGSYAPGAYGPILLSPGMVPMPNWSPYSVKRIQSFYSYCSLYV